MYEPLWRTLYVGVRVVVRVVPVQPVACHQGNIDTSSNDSVFDELERTFLPPEDFVKMLAQRRVDFFTGVPDSLLKDFCAYVTDHVPSTHHVIASNEGAAVGLAAGYQMASRKYPLVYLQNSGLGNIVNPLLSLTDRKVCIPPPSW